MNIDERKLILPVFDTVILPDVDYRLNMGQVREEEKKAIEQSGEKIVILSLRELKDNTELWNSKTQEQRTAEESKFAENDRMLKPECKWKEKKEAFDQLTELLNPENKLSKYSLSSIS